MILFPMNDWTAFKALAARKRAKYQFQETSTQYDIYLWDGNFVWNMTLLKDGGSDVTDFETTFKAAAGGPVHHNIQFQTSYSNITGNRTTVVKAAPGILHSIIINNNTTGGTITVYDNSAGSGTKIMTLTLGSPSGGLLSTSGQPGPVSIGPLGILFATGLTIVTAGSASNDITACFQ